MPVPALVEPGPPLAPEQVSRYARHLLLPAIGEVGQRRLLAARVAVVGAGGLGSPALLYLAAAGIGSLTVIDHDVVDITNLQRQVIHDAMSVGLPKTESAVDRVRSLNPDCAVNGRPVRITGENACEILAGHHLVLDGSDNFETRYVVDTACAAMGMPLVWAAVYRSAAQLTTFWTDPPAGWPAVGLRDLFPIPPAPGSVPDCGDAGVLGALVGQVGSMMANEAIKLLVGEGEPLLGRVLFIDSLAGTQREIPLAPSRRYGPGGYGSGHTHDGLTATAAAQRAPAERRMLARDLAARLRTTPGAAAAPFVLDVRSTAETVFGTVPGAVNIPVGVVTTTDPDSLGIPRDRDVILVCKAGQRALSAASALRSYGYERLSILDGGMLAWIDEVDPALPRY